MPQGKETSVGVKLVADLRNYQKNMSTAQKQTRQFKQNVKQNVGEVGSAFTRLMRGDITALPGFFKSATGAAGGFSTGLKGVKAALIATGIGAILVGIGAAIGALTQYFKGTEEGQIAFKKVMNKVKAYVEPVLHMFGQFGKAIVQLFKGDFKGAWETAKSAVKGVGDQIKENNKNVGALNDAEEKYIKFKRKTLLENKKLEAEINEARRIANDEDNYSAQQRAAAINSAIAKQKQLAANKQEELKLQRFIEETKASFGDNDIATNDKLNQLKAEQFDIISEQERAIKRMAEDQQRINRELQAEITARQKAADIIKELRTNGEGLTTLTTRKEVQFAGADTSQLDKMTEKTIEAKEQAATLREEFQKIGQDAIPGITDAMGQMIAGTKGAFGNLVASMLDGIRKILSARLAEAIAGMIAGEAPKGLVGLITASIGVGAITALFNSKVPKFADGGLAYGPTVGLMGEYAGARANPEVIAPLNKLQDLINPTGATKTEYLQPVMNFDGEKFYLNMKKVGERINKRT